MYTPQRLFGEVATSSDVLAHEPFLERARRQREQELDQPARLALGAYVVARLIDKLLTLDSNGEALEAFRWQLEAVRRHVADLPSEAPETAHLRGVVEAISARGRPSSNLSPSLTAYAYFLEQEGRLEESLEALRLAARSQGPETPVADFTGFALFAGRLNRMLARWEPASTCYAAAEDAGLAAGDMISALRGRLGRGAVHRGQGNYPLAKSIAEGVVSEATERALPQAQALAYADLGTICTLLGLRLDALRAHYEAFRLTEDSLQRMCTLNDLAIDLYGIGAIEAARLAFEIVIKSNASFLVRGNSLLELMDLESSINNRVAFERCRALIEREVKRLSPSMATDYQFKLGIGFSRFGQVSRAREALTSALDLASVHGLNAWYFKIEQALQQLSAEHNTRSADKEVTAREVRGPAEVPLINEVHMGLQEYAELAGA